MNIEVIGKDKIKVIITGTELAERNLNHENIKSGSVYLNEFMFEIMEKVRLTTPFNPYAGQVMVEAMKSGDGLVLIISKVKTKCKLSKEQKEKIRRAKPVLKKSETIVYIFEDFWNLCDAIKLVDNDILKTSALYRVDEKYYFCIDEGYGLSKNGAVLREFCTEVLNRDIKYYLEEHNNLKLVGEDLAEFAINAY